MDAEFSEINVTPFTDVLLVLLVIFMILAALVIPPGFERALPCNCNQPITDGPPPRRVEVAITQAGAITVDGVRTTETGLYAVLSRASHRMPRAKLDIVADAHARYGLIVRALDAAKEANLTDVSFVTQ